MDAASPPAPLICRPAEFQPDAYLQPAHRERGERLFNGCVLSFAILIGSPFLALFLLPLGIVLALGGFAGIVIALLSAIGIKFMRDDPLKGLWTGNCPTCDSTISVLRATATEPGFQCPVCTARIINRPGQFCRVP